MWTSWFRSPKLGEEKKKPLSILATQPLQPCQVCLNLLSYGNCLFWHGERKRFGTHSYELFSIHFLKFLSVGINADLPRVCLPSTASLESLSDSQQSHWQRNSKNYIKFILEMSSPVKRVLGINPNAGWLCAYCFKKQSGRWIFPPKCTGQEQTCLISLPAQHSWNVMTCQTWQVDWECNYIVLKA